MKRVQVFGNGEAEVKIYPLRRKGTRYQSFQVSWNELGERRTKTLADPLEAKSCAQQVHVSLLNKARAEDVTPQDIQMLRDAESMVAKFGVSLPFAIREWVDARTLLGSAILGNAKSLADALHGVQDINVKEATKKFIEAKERAGLSQRHVETIRAHVQLFAKKFINLSLTQVTATDIDSYVTAAKGSPRTKNNLIATIKTFFIWAQKHNYLRQDRQPVTAMISKLREPSSTPEIFTVDEITAILKAADPEMVPYFAIDAFAGLRSAEIERLDWSAFDFETGYIRLEWEITKTRQRRLVPILPNLREWLMPHKRESGPVCPPRHRRKIVRCATRAKVLWKSNALRHSYRSYRIADLQDVAKVALEMGNSPQMLFKHYRELMTPEQATKWFGIKPAMA